MIADWIDVGPVQAIPPRGSRTVPVQGGDEIALFRTHDERVFALVNRCPHKHGPLSQGIVHGHAVTCPLHNWRISLETGEALGDDRGCTPTIPVRVDAGRVLIARAALVAAAIAA
ncbi:nitrite reductase small subunit NirD [Sphingomonas corticis]|uniref:Nitrite reductase small subunit NirD n=1 Tax=Sphingomonas corticis TaxID=2722791 RepID=A0ABX1CRC6_9SPHN|nr:nitrite reductase small subunit NirD [Sphingomonas corticis]NJR80505.1 nitrite reductase small subunit NirD [Sphingomonas corticis]